MAEYRLDLRPLMALENLVGLQLENTITEAGEAEGSTTSAAAGSSGGTMDDATTGTNTTTTQGPKTQPAHTQPNTLSNGGAPDHPSQRDQNPAQPMETDEMVAGPVRSAEDLPAGGDTALPLEGDDLQQEKTNEEILGGKYVAGSTAESDLDLNLSNHDSLEGSGAVTSSAVGAAPSTYSSSHSVNSMCGTSHQQAATTISTLTVCSLAADSSPVVSSPVVSSPAGADNSLLEIKTNIQSENIDTDSDIGVHSLENREDIVQHDTVNSDINLIPSGEDQHVDTGNTDDATGDSNANNGGGDRSVSGTTSGSPDADIQFLWENVKCVFCSALAKDQEPKLLPCLHSACNKCLTHEASEPENKDDEVVAMDPLIHCPACKKGFAQDIILDNMFICEASGIGGGSVAAVEEMFTCTSCDDEARATGFCTDCSEWLCDGCIQAHKRVKVTKDHVIKGKGEETPCNSKSSQVKKMFSCNVHPKEKLNLYCQTCDQLTCRDCQLIEHREHKYKFSEEMASVTRERLKTFLSDIRKKRGYIENAKELVAERRQQILSKQESVHADINRLVETFIEIIRQRGSTLFELLREVCAAKQEQLDKKNEVLLHLGSQADHCITIADAVLNSASDMALLFSKKLLMEQVMKVDKDSPDRSLFDRFKAKLNSGDDISLRISSESRGLGKALKDVGYLLVDNKIYPPPDGNSGVKSRSSQPSPVEQSSSSSSSPQPGSAAASATAQPQPPALTPMHSHMQHHHQQQHQITAGNNMHHKFHNFGPAPSGAANPPGLVRIQPKPSPGSNSLSAAGVAGSSTAQSLSSFSPRMPQLTQGRPSDVSSSVSSTTHPPGENSHLRGLLGSGGSYKLNTFNPPFATAAAARLSSQTPHSANQSGSSQQNSSARGALQPFRGGGLNPAAAAAAAMAATTGSPISSITMAGGMSGAGAGSSLGIMSMAAQLNAPSGISITPVPQHNQKSQQQLQNFQSKQQQQQQQQQQQITLQGILRNTLSQPPVNLPKTGNDNRQPSPHSTASGVKKESNSPSPSWHTPQTADQTSGSSSGGSMLTMPQDSVDNSFKIMLGSNKTTSNTGDIGSPEECKSKGIPAPSVSITIAGLSTTAASLLEENTKTESQTAAVDSSCSPSTPSVTSNGETRKKQDEPNALDSEDSLPELQIDTGSNGESPENTNGQKGDNTKPAAGSYKPGEQVQWKKDPNDPNEDWCAVCWDGGDLVCCEFCPKVFHDRCHIPHLQPLGENEKWQCLLCTDLENAKFDEPDIGGKRRLGLTKRELRVMQRILLEIFCNYEASQPFRELVDKELTEYYEIIKKPMALEIIKKKMVPGNEEHYEAVEDFVKDIRLIFKNCYEFNPKGTEIYSYARILEDNFEQLLERWLPNVSVEASKDADSDYEPGSDADTPEPKKRKKTKEAQSDQSLMHIR